MKHLIPFLSVVAIAIGIVGLISIVASGDANAVPTGLSTYAIPTIISAAPAEPYACAPGVEGHIVYVDDSDDELWGMLCVCNFNDDGTGFLWLGVDDPGTPCIFV